MKLATPLTTLHGVGDSLQTRFAKLDIFTIGDLLYSFPRTYLDYSKRAKLAELDTETRKTFIAEVRSVKNIFLRGRGNRTLQKVTLADNTATIEAVWFNMPFLENALVVGEEYAFVGKLNRNKRNNKLQLTAPEYEKIKETMLNTDRIVPAYSLTHKLSPKVYRKLIKQVLDNIDLLEDLRDEDYGQILREDLPSKTKALTEIHFPSSFTALESAKMRLGIDELVPIQIQLIKQARLREKANSATSGIDFGEEIISKYWQKYPFDPTADQLSTCEEILTDFIEKPIYRLIQGDVGSGKTAVAGFAVELCLRSNTDVLLMVPTTVLARQHFEKLQRIFPDQVHLVTADSEVGKDPLEQSKKGRLFIGTQAILHRYQNLNLELGMLIVDEEHRFGVKQREELAKITSTNLDNTPHYLSLTATPIPRTLALSIFGNIDISVIRTKPKGQLERKTYIVPEEKRKDGYQWIREKVEEGTQVFWICPLIEDTKEVDNNWVFISKDEKASVEKVYKHLKKIYPQLKIKALHGKLKNETKEKLLQDFRDKKFDILVSTTVIEVGIDIPNANLMVIEDANRFGLAQLHQLRGRVGRGEDQGYCLLFNPLENAGERLKTFAKENDGLKLAEYDLQTRGPGEVYGRIQSGIPNLKIADFTNEKQIAYSRRIAMAKMS
jgi:ATP-dependent DNA helicase RecG